MTPQFTPAILTAPSPPCATSKPASPTSILGIALGGILTEKKALSQTVQICASSPVPTGWVVTSISTNLTQCGGFSNNVLTIQNASILSPGSSLSICPSSFIPTGWVVTNISTNLAQCGRCI